MVTIKINAGVHPNQPKPSPKKEPDDQHEPERVRNDERADGYPIRLFAARDNTLQGVIPSTEQSVSAVAQTEAGTANVHLALITSSTSSGGADKSAVAQTDLIGLSTSQ